ncbi:MAG: NAD(P)H-quinone oxidoreductase [Deltaproteobacteria bacterium]|nr:NAD(P)H-quinone oxidoreductase [Deltaproteobacteria bacterium]
MKAISVENDADRSLRWREHPTPRPGAGEVLLRVQATAVNRADLVQRAGAYPPPAGASEILGLEAAGVVAAVGEGVDGWSVGDEACCLLAGGGYAEYVACHHRVLLPVPRGLSVREAAALPEVFFTAYLNLFMEGGLAPGERALVHAGASGVGTAAVQLCRLFDRRIYVTASAGKLAALRELGADAAIDREAEDFVSRVHELTASQGVDVILDPVGGAYLSRNLTALSLGGRLVVIGLLGGARGELPMGMLLMRRLRIIGSVLRSRSVEEKAAIRDELLARVWPHFAAGALRPIVDRTLPIDRADEAHALLKSNATFGKVVLTIPS